MYRSLWVTYLLYILPRFRTVNKFWLWIILSTDYILNKLQNWLQKCRSGYPEGIVSPPPPMSMGFLYFQLFFETNHVRCRAKTFQSFRVFCLACEVKIAGMIQNTSLIRETVKDFSSSGEISFFNPCYPL